MARIRFPSSLFLFLFLSLILVATAAPARADDAVKEDTPAGKAFRDAWWAETGAGKLDVALDGYRAALAAEGSEGVRARALYRMGLVLQRMGRTDEALKAMKQLADEFPGEQALLARAKARLEEWTAVDLRDQFPEWYKRYQYSPEFQAKIVDLVLKLGVSDNKSRNQAEQELLTIGEPAIPALLQHAGSANRTLARGVTDLLLAMGRLPPADRAFDETSWYRDRAFWNLLHEADEATKAAYRAAAAAQEERGIARWVEASLAGSEAILEALRHQEDAWSRIVYPVLLPWFADRTVPASFFQALRAMVLDEDVPADVRGVLAGALQPEFDFAGEAPHPYGLTPEEVIRWARADHASVRMTAWRAMGAARVHAQEALDAVTSFVLESPMLTGRDDRQTASGAILGILRMRDTQDGTEDAVHALVDLLEAGGMNQMNTNALRDWGPQGLGSPAVPARVLAQAIGRVRGKHANGLVTSWHGHQQALSEAERQAQLLAWAVSAADGQVRRDAMMHAARNARDDVRALTAPIARDEASAGLVQAFFSGLLSGNNQALPWDAESITRMVEAAQRHFDRETNTAATSQWTVAGMRFRTKSPYQQQVPYVFVRMLHEGDSLPAFFEAAVLHPERFDGDVWYLLGDSWKEAPAQRAMVLDALRRGWARWRPAQREAGLDALLRETTIEKGDPDTDALLREFLRSEGNTPTVRGQLLEYVSELSLDDVRGAFDLSTPEGVDQAAPLLPRLPRKAEVYDAFVPALRPDGAQYHHVFTWFRGSEDDVRVRDMLSRMLQHEHGSAALQAINFLNSRTDTKDLPVWMLALGHPQNMVRVKSAQRLGYLYNADVIQALARAVDDPAPEVRDAVLASLERIQTTEEQKRRWRKFAETGKLPEDDG